MNDLNLCKALIMMFRNRGSSHSYIISEFDHSTSNRSPSSLTASNQSNNTSSTALSHNSQSYNNSNNNNYNQTNSELSQKRFGNYLTPEIKIRNTIF